MRSSRRLALGCLSALLAACSTAPVRVQSRAVDDLPAARGAPAAATCLALGAFVDARPTAELGTLGFREFAFDDYPGWLERQLRGKLAQDAHAPGAQLLKIELLRAYLETNRSTLSFTVVLRAALPDAAAQVFRGTDTKVSWFGSEDELGNFIERASAQAIAQLLAVEGKACTAS